MLPVGKLEPGFLHYLLQRYTQADERILAGAAIGEDATVIDFGQTCLVAKTDPITFATDEIGWYAVNVNANDIAVTGGIPRWFLATILLPEGRADEALTEEILRQLSSACAEIGVSLCGGHTEVTYGLDRPIVVGQMLGEVPRDGIVTSRAASPATTSCSPRALPSRRRRSSRARRPPTCGSGTPSTSCPPAVGCCTRRGSAC